MRVGGGQEQQQRDGGCRGRCPSFRCAGMLSPVRGYFAKSDITTEALLLVIVSFFFLHVSLSKY